MEIGHKVKRKENRRRIRATVLEIDETDGSVLIEYEEGGQGWWPEEYLDHDNNK